MLKILPAYQSLFSNWQFDDFFQLEGEVYRQTANRCTLKFERGGQHFFIKRHQGTHWTEIIKNLSQGKWPVLSAATEWQAIQWVRAAGIHTLQPVAWGQAGWYPSRRRSFIITEALAATISLEEYDWSQLSLRNKRAWIRQLAWISARLHEYGLSHRDLYLCHFLIPKDWQRTEIPPIYLIDLHRLKKYQHLPRRWRSKDLASLYYSALRIGLKQRDALYFLKHYYQQPLRLIDQQYAQLLKQIQKRYQRLRAREHLFFAPDGSMLK